MKLKLEIELGNAEMQTFGDLADALQGIAGELRNRGYCAQVAREDSGRVRDINGNTVGSWELLED